ncbi:hypothetical protein ACT3SP_15535 [Brachybacterium sp. AOP43-C2-M15]|uniref:hypothetical protein n=1 Tax=Brachybacterium sp. AOP43-C2-M15 TaxID=3457661 RepID=UPI0040334164
MSPQPEPSSTPEASDPARTARTPRAAGDLAMQRATLVALVVGLVLDAVVIAVAATRDDPAALAGALVGTGLTLVIVLPTVVITFLGRRLTPISMAATVLGSWAGKMLIVILVLLAVRDLDGVSARWIGLALLVGAVSAVLIEGLLFARARRPLDVEPVDDPEEGPGARARP